MPWPGWTWPNSPRLGAVFYDSNFPRHRRKRAKKSKQTNLNLSSAKTCERARQDDTIIPNAKNTSRAACLETIFSGGGGQNGEREMKNAAAAFSLDARNRLLITRLFIYFLPALPPAPVIRSSFRRRWTRPIISI
jgi:hypothetical protein